MINLILTGAYYLAGYITNGSVPDDVAATRTLVAMPRWGIGRAVVGAGGGAMLRRLQEQPTGGIGQGNECECAADGASIER